MTTEENYTATIAAFEDAARHYNESDARALGVRSALLLRVRAGCLGQTDLLEWLLDEEDEIRQVALRFVPKAR